MGKEGQQVPEMTDEYCDEVSRRYIELYEHITGLEFHRADESALQERIFANVSECLGKLNEEK